MFKKRFTETALAICLVMSAGAAPAAVQDIAVNGGFETGDFSGWTQFPQSGTQTIFSPGSSGTFAANLSVGPIPSGGGGVDNVLKNANNGAGSLTPGASITVTWDMRGVATAPGAVVFIELFSELSAGGVSAAEIYTGGPLFPNDPVNWTSYSWTTTLGPDVSGGATLQLKVACGGVENCEASVDFDNITMTTDVSAIPVPAAVGLFGSGLVGLVGVARRNKAA